MVRSSGDRPWVQIFGELDSFAEVFHEAEKTHTVKSTVLKFGQL